MSKTSSGEVGEVKKKFQLLFLSQSEKWCAKGIFERTLSAIVEKKSLKTSETIEGSDVIELSSFNEILEDEFVDFTKIVRIRIKVVSVIAKSFLLKRIRKTIRLR